MCVCATRARICLCVCNCCSVVCVVRATPSHPHWQLLDDFMALTQIGNVYDKEVAHGNMQSDDDDASDGIVLTDDEGVCVCVCVR